MTKEQFIEMMTRFKEYKDIQDEITVAMKKLSPDFNFHRAYCACRSCALPCGVHPRRFSHNAFYLYFHKLLYNFAIFRLCGVKGRGALHKVRIFP